VGLPHTTFLRTPTTTFSYYGHRSPRAATHRLLPRACCPPPTFTCHHGGFDVVAPLPGTHVLRQLSTAIPSTATHTARVGCHLRARVLPYRAHGSGRPLLFHACFAAYYPHLLQRGMAHGVPAVFYLPPLRAATSRLTVSAKCLSHNLHAPSAGRTCMHCALPAHTGSRYRCCPFLPDWIPYRAPFAPPPFAVCTARQIRLNGAALRHWALYGTSLPWGCTPFRVAISNEGPLRHYRHSRFTTFLRYRTSLYPIPHFYHWQPTFPYAAAGRTRGCRHAARFARALPLTIHTTCPLPLYLGQNAQAWLAVFHSPFPHFLSLRRFSSTFAHCTHRATRFGLRSWDVRMTRIRRRVDTNAYLVRKNGAAVCRSARTRGVAQLLCAGLPPAAPHCFAWRAPTYRHPHCLPSCHLLVACLLWIAGFAPGRYLVLLRLPLIILGFFLPALCLRHCTHIGSVLLLLLLPEQFTRYIHL